MAELAQAFGIVSESTYLVTTTRKDGKRTYVFEDMPEREHSGTPEV